MIHITIKVKNDHRSLSESFEAEEILLGPHSDQIVLWTAKVMKDFVDPVDEVIVKTKMVI